MDHSFFLRQALDQAEKAKDEGQNPIGCVIVDENGQVIARAHSEVNRRNDRTAHAEMLAISKAIGTAGNENASRWTLYTTIEPCVVCLGTIVMAHIGTVVWGSGDRHMEAHKIMTTLPYLRTRKLITIACPDPEIEKACKKVHDEYWISVGRPDAIQSIETED